jgi:transcriptional regulator with XRE-family HTH domain
VRNRAATLVRLREASGLSRRAIARRLGVSATALLRYECGTSPVPEAIADAIRRLALEEKLLAAVRSRRPLSPAALAAAVGGQDASAVLASLVEAGRLEVVNVERWDRAGKRRRHPRVFIAGEAPPALEVPPAERVTSAWLRDQRRAFGWTSEEAARRAGVAGSTFRLWETGRRPIPAAREAALEAALQPSPAKVRRARLDRGLTLEDLGTRVGLSLSVIHTWENGEPIAPHRREALRRALLDVRPTPRTEAAAAAIVSTVRTHPGLTHHGLLHRFGRSRRRDRTWSVPETFLLGLKRALERGELVEVDAEQLDQMGRPRRARRLYVAGEEPRATVPEMTGDELRRERLRRGLSARQVGREVGLTGGAVSAMERRGSARLGAYRSARLRAALEALGDAREQLRSAIEGAVRTSPGISRYRLEQRFGQGARPAAALDELVQGGVVVLAPATDPLGRSYQGLYLASDAPSEPAPEPPSGPELRAMRQRAGLRQRDIAERMGVRPSAVVRWESGERRMPPRRLPAFLAALDQPPPTRIDRRERLARRLASAVEGRPEGIQRGELGPLIYGPLGEAGLDLALERGLVHWQERVVATRAGRGYLRRFLVPGPAPEEPCEAPRLSGAELRERRLALGLTQVALAQALGVTNTRVSTWERGWTRLGPDKSAAIRRALASLEAAAADRQTDRQAGEHP